MGNSSNQTDRFWKCDYCICDHYPKWRPCGCACSTHKKESCPQLDPAKVKAYKKRKAEQDQERSVKRLQENQKQEDTEQGFLTFTQEFTDQVAQAEPLVVPNFGTMSRIRDIWLKCPYFVPNLEYFGLKIGTLVIFIHFCTTFLLLVSICPDFHTLIRS